MCVHPINSQSFEYLFSSGKYLYKSSLFISLISNVENPGVSAIYELLSNLYKYVFHQSFGTSKNYRCSYFKKGCQSSIVVSSSGGITTNKKLHNHEINREKGNYR